MPIRPEWRKFYGREWRTVTRVRILARAGNKCEQCGKPDRRRVETFSEVSFMGRRMMFWRVAGRGWRDWTGSPIPLAAARSEFRAICVVLTIAHLNHTPGDDRDENLKALCQWCHLNYDKRHHKETRSTRKDAARPLLSEARL